MENQGWCVVKGNDGIAAVAVVVVEFVFLSCFFVHIFRVFWVRVLRSFPHDPSKCSSYSLLLKSRDLETNEHVCQKTTFFQSVFKFGAAVGKEATFDGCFDTAIVSWDGLGAVRQEATTPLRVVTGFCLFSVCVHRWWVSVHDHDGCRELFGAAGALQRRNPCGGEIGLCCVVPCVVGQ